MQLGDKERPYIQREGLGTLETQVEMKEPYPFLHRKVIWVEIVFGRKEIGVEESVKGRSHIGAVAMLGRGVLSAGENGEEERSNKRDLEGCDQDLAGRRKRKVRSTRTWRGSQVKTLGG